MELNATHNNNIVVLAPRGRIDHLNAEAFGKAVHLGCLAGPVHAFEGDEEAIHREELF